MFVNAINLIILIVLSIFFSCTSCKRDFSSLEEQKGCLIPTDTTSHHFTWTIDTLGEYGSVLRDVSIISENEVWAGGELKKNDNFYNAVKWTGSEWFLDQIPLKIWQTNDYIPSRLNAIIALWPDDIWVTNKGEVVHFNGTDWDKRNFLFTNLDDQTFGGINSFWAASSGDIFAVGNKGNFFRYNGNRWERFNNITTTDLNHITGYTDPKTGNTQLWACGRTTLLYSEDGQNWQIVWDENNPFLRDNYLNPTAIQVVGNCLVVAVFYNQNTRIYLVDPDNPFEFKMIAQFNAYIYDISGNALNDLFFVGSEHKIFHFNGSTTHHYSDLTNIGQLLATDKDENGVFIVGYIGSPFSKAIIIHGIR